jgi:hypothetical protein
MKANKLLEQSCLQSTEIQLDTACKRFGLSNIWTNTSIDHKNMLLLETQSWAYRIYIDAKHSM